MKNKLLVSVFALAMAAFALSSCESESDVTEVCSDMIKETMHKYARSLVQLNDQTLTVSEYEFLGDVNDNRMVYRTISFGNGTFEPKTVDTLTYEYGTWNENYTSSTLLVTPPTGEPYSLLFQGNAFTTPQGLVYGGEGTENTARVDKWENTIASLPNTTWDGTFEGEYVLDSVYMDSIRTIFIPPMTFITDTIKVPTGEMDTLSADTTCNIRIELNRDPVTLANTGHYYKKSARSTYDRKTGEATIVSENVEEYDVTWFFTDVTSDAKFTVVLQSTDPGKEPVTLGISKYKTDEDGQAVEFLMGGVTYTRP